MMQNPLHGERPLQSNVTDLKVDKTNA